MLPNPFPPTSQALDEPNGLLAIGGDLTPETLLCAYAQGIFPWFEPDQDILWWTPNPRLVLFPEQVHTSRSLCRTLKKCDWTITYDRGFSEVVSACAAAPRNQREPGTWITPDMQAAYVQLHELGVAHSIEIRGRGELIGGLYGILLGRIFFGESMFSRVTDASKAAFTALARLCLENDIDVIDCQVHNPHLASLGATPMSREGFEKTLRGVIKEPMASILSNPRCLLPKEPAPLDQRLGKRVPRRAMDLL